MKLAENLVLRGERRVAQSFLDAAGSAGDFENEDVLAEVARMEELLRLPFDDVDGYEQWLFLHFHLQCLAEAERDNENFGAIFEHMYELYMQQPQGHVRPRGHHSHHGGEGGESEYPTDDESENDDETDGMREGSGPEENPEESRTRARPTFTAFPTVRDRERNPEDADPHNTETMDVQRTMEESKESLQRALQILRMRYDHTVLQRRMEEARELAMEITRLEGFQSFM